MEPLIVTAFTEDYQGAALSLAAGAVSNGMRILLAPYPDRGRWIENCRQKPILIHQLRCSGPGGEAAQPLLWIDADGALLRRPPQDLLEELALAFDFAACPSRADLGRRYCSGTFWVNSTGGASRFVACWADLCAKGQGSDEAQLQSAVQLMQAETRLGDLPFAWGWLPRDGPPNQETVIQHRLSGRRKKAEITMSHVDAQAAK